MLDGVAIAAIVECTRDSTHFKCSPVTTLTPDCRLPTRTRTLLGALLVAVLCARAEAAEVSGRLGSGRPGAPALRVYAWSRSTGHLYSLANGTAIRYRLELPRGHYWLFAGLEGAGASPIYGAYTEYVRCVARTGAADAECVQHGLAEVEVGTRALNDVDLIDWALPDDVATGLDSLLGRPPGDPYDESGRAAPKFSEYPARRSAPSGPDAHDLAGERGGDREVLLTALGEAANFAGRWSLVPLGCATACSGIALLDHTTGSVLYPEALNPLPDPAPCETRASLQYRRDSRLLIVRSGGKGGKGAATVTYYTVDGEPAALKAIASRALAEPGPAHCPQPLARR